MFRHRGKRIVDRMQKQRLAVIATSSHAADSDVKSGALKHFLSTVISVRLLQIAIRILPFCLIVTATLPAGNEMEFRVAFKTSSLDLVRSPKRRNCASMFKHFVAPRLADQLKFAPPSFELGILGVGKFIQKCLFSVSEVRPVRRQRFVADVIMRSTALKTGNRALAMGRSRSTDPIPRNSFGFCQGVIRRSPARSL